MVTGDRLCDHGYLPIELVRAGVIKGGIACDINSGPLERAEAHIKDAGLSDVIETRRSDGLFEIGEEEADSVTVCGLGGRLAAHILKTNPSLCRRVSELILQPQSDTDWLKGRLFEAGYRLLDEDMVFEDGKSYRCMKYRYAPEEEAGRKTLLDARSHPVYRDYLLREVSRFQKILQQLPPEAVKRREEILRKQERVEALLGEVI